MTSKIGKYKVVFFDSIDALDYERFSLFNKYVMLDSQLGSTVMDFDKNTVKVHQYLKNNMIKEARQELSNLRNIVHNILTENNVRGLAFAVMIKSINGELVTDFGVDSLNEILSNLSKEGLTGVRLYEDTDTLKKK